MTNAKTLLGRVLFLYKGFYNRKGIQAKETTYEQS
ncbi:hypothetical protein BBOR36S_02450 [Brevibacillus borstelensis]